MLAATRPRWVTKPPIGSKIDTRHDLAEGLVGCWLLNEFASISLNDLSQNRNTMTLANTSSANPDWYAGTIRSQGQDSGAETTHTGVPSALQLQEVTLLWRGVIQSGPTANSVITGAVWGDTSPFLNYGILNASTSGQIYTISSTSISLNGSITYGQETVVILTSSVVTGVDALWINGINKVTTVGTPGITKSYSGAGFFSIGRYSTTNRDSKAGTRQVLVYNRILNAEEIVQVSTDSFCMIANLSAVRNPSRVWAVSAGATGNRRRRILCAGRAA